MEEGWSLGKLVLAKEVVASLSVGADIKRRLLPSEPVGVGQLECGCTQSQLVLTKEKGSWCFLSVGVGERGCWCIPVSWC